MSSSENKSSFASAVINSSKRKRVQTPSPAKNINNSTVGATVEEEQPKHDHDEHCRRFTIRRRSASAVAKSKTILASIPPPMFDDELPISVGCQTTLSQTVLEENELIEYYIKLANKERRAFNKERRDKHKVLNFLEKEAQVTEMITRTITDCLKVGEAGLLRVKDLDAAFPKWSFAGNATQAEVNAKILCEVEKHKRSTKEYQFVVQNIVSKIGEAMDEFERIKSLDVSTPSDRSCPAYVPDFNQSNSSLLSQVLTSNSSSTASQIAARHSARTPARKNFKSVKSRANVKFSSPINKFLAKETIELEIVNPVSTIEIEKSNAPDRSDEHSFPKFSEVNSRDINLDKCNISQEIKSEFKNSPMPQGIKASQTILKDEIDDSDWHDLELEDFSQEWLDSQEASSRKEWEAFCKTEAPSDSDK